MVYGGAIKLSCEHCSKYPEEARKFKGCNGPAPVPLYELDGEKIWECPGKLITLETSEFLQIYSACKLFHKLPVEGGVLDQTFHFSQAAIIVESTLAEILESKKPNG